MTTERDLLDTLLEELENSSFDEMEVEMDELRIHLVREGAAPAGGPSGSFRREARSRTAPQDSAQEAPAETSPTTSQPKPQASPSHGETTPTAVSEDVVAVRAPLSGTFYHAPSPGEPVFIEVGSTVGSEDPIGLVEVMKLFNTVKAGVAGTVTAIVTDNAAVVKEGDALIHIRPDA